MYLFPCEFNDIHLHAIHCYELLLVRLKLGLNSFHTIINVLSLNYNTSVKLSNGRNSISIFDEVLFFYFHTSIELSLSVFMILGTDAMTGTGTGADTMGSGSGSGTGSGTGSGAGTTGTTGTGTGSGSFSLIPTGRWILILVSGPFRCQAA